MTTSRVETVPTIWDDTRDLPFFHVTARLFTADFCLGASVLLATYDDDAVDAVPDAFHTRRATRPARPGTPVEQPPDSGCPQPGGQASLARPRTAGISQEQS
jgi:hypothetical protein